MSKQIHIMQHDEKDCGAACLSMIASYYGRKLPIAKFRELIQIDHQGANIYGITNGAEQIGLNADALEGEYEELRQGICEKEILFPFIARIVNQEGYEHFIVVYAYQDHCFTIADPAKTGITKMQEELFQSQWLGNIITFSPNENFRKGNENKRSLSKFFSYIFAEKKTVLKIVILTIFISVINMFGTTIFQYVIDGMTQDANHISGQNLIQNLIAKISIVFQSLDKICITVLILYIFQLCIQIIRSFLAAGASVRMDFSMTKDLFQHLIRLPFPFFGTRKTGEILSRFDNLSEIRTALSSVTATLLIDTGMAIAFGILLFFMSPVLFLITVVFLILYGLVLFAFKNRIKTANHTYMDAEAMVTSHLKESIDGIEAIKANRYEPASQKKLEQLTDAFEKQTFHLYTLDSVQNALVGLIDSASIVCLLWVGSYLCAMGNLSVGGLFAYYYMMNYFLNPISNLIQLQPTLQSAIVAAERLNDILDAAPEETSQNTKELSDIQEICIQDLTFAYGNREPVLHHLNMQIQKGQKIAIVGESGCGKTTLAKLLMRFYDCTPGMIKLNQTNIQDYDLDQIRQKCVYISQNTFLFSDSIRNNLIMGRPDIYDDDIEHVCKLCHADEFIRNMPAGYSSVLEENGANLSGGQRQRLAIARALLQKPQVIIMDEATSNLDSVTEKGIQSVIDDLPENITCIIIAHRLKTIKNCDQIYVLEHGTVCEHGTHEDLMAKNQVYASYWRD